MKTVVVLFDGVCTLCNGFADFIVRRDKNGVFKLGTLQSPAGQECLKRAGLPPDFVESVVAIEGDRVFNRSTAALRIMRELGFPWRLVSVFVLVPKPIRDTIYDWVARNRYQWFGKRDSCRVPTEAERDHFLR